MNTTTAQPKITRRRALAAGVGLLLGPPARATQDRSMWMTIGEQRYAVALEDNPAARALGALLPLSLDMAELNGNEKHARLPRALPDNASRIGTIRAGDVLLYGDDTLVVFYEDLSSSYRYTRIGRVQQPGGLAQALGPVQARVRFTAP